MRRGLGLSLLLLLVLGSPARANPVPDPQLAARLAVADRFFRLPESIRDSLVPPRWLADGDRLVFWAREGVDGGTWTLADAATGELKPLISGAQLRAQLSALLGKPVTAPRFYEVAIAPDQQRIAFRLDDAVFALGLAGGRVVRLAAEDRTALLLSRSHFAAPRGGGLAVQRAAGFAVQRADGTTVLERAAEEHVEWRIPDRPWSPDGRFLVVRRVDSRGVHKLPVVDTSTALERVTMVPYVKSGTPLPRNELHVVELATGKITRVAPVENEAYDWFAGWNPDATEALCLHLSRDGKRLELTAVDPASATRRRVLREDRPQTFVAGLDLEVGGWAKQVMPLPGGKGYLWLSERDGWRHVYLYDRAGRLVRQVTKGSFPVHEVVAIAPAGDAVLVIASAEPGAPYEHVLYRGSLQGGALARLSSGTGLHRITMAPSGRYFVDAWSSRSEPRLRELVAVDGGKRVRLTTADASGVAALGYVPPDALVVKAADGVTPLHGVIYKPHDFTPARRYPVIAYIYGGPFTTAVPWSYVGTGMSLACAALAQLGFVVVLVDLRGGPGRSKAFQDVTYGRVGQTEIADYATALKQAGATRPWMDLQRVGIYGHSWGGYFALRGMLTAPELFKAGYAAAPGALEEDALVNEPYLGLPSANPAGYAAGSNAALAGKLVGHLKLMHGTADIDAPMSTTLRMAEALVRAGKHFELLIMPGEPHTPRPPGDRFYFDDVGMFFARTLGGPR